MWPGERESLAVWADGLQARGDPQGEVVALALRADELDRRGDDPLDAKKLADQAETSRRALASRLLGPFIAELPGLELSWQLGAIRSLTLADPEQPLDRGLALEVLRSLVQLPALARLDHLHLSYLSRADDLLEIVELLSRDECQARARRLVLGPMPRRFRVIHSFVRPPTWTWRDGDLLADGGASLARLAERGLSWMIHRGGVQALPWARGDAGSRLQRLERLLAEPWTPEHASLLGRALWDTSERVRRRLLAAIPGLPDAAALLLPAVIASNLDRPRQFGDLVERTLTRASTRPRWVAAVAENLYRCEPWVASWLAAVSRRSRAEAEAAIPRLIELYEVSTEPFARHRFAQAITSLGGSLGS